MVYAWWGFHNQGVRKWTKAWRRENAKCTRGWGRVGWELSEKYSRKIIYKHKYKALNASLTDIYSVSNGNPFKMSKEGKSCGPSIYPFICPSLHPSIIASMYLYEYGIWESTHPLNLYSHSALCSLSDVWQIIQLPSASLSWKMGIIRSSSYTFHQDYHAIIQVLSKQGHLEWLLEAFLKSSNTVFTNCYPYYPKTFHSVCQFQPFAKALDFIPYQRPYQYVRTASLSWDHYFNKKEKQNQAPWPGWTLLGQHFWGEPECITSVPVIVCPLIDEDERLVEASWWEGLAVGKTGPCSGGHGLLSKSLIQFSAGGQGCVSTL